MFKTHRFTLVAVAAVFASALGANAVPAHNAMTAPSAADRMFMSIPPHLRLGACAPIVAIATDTIRAHRARQPARDRAKCENLCQSFPKKF